MTIWLSYFRVTVCIALAVLCLSTPVSAEPKTFAQADAAWHKGELENSKGLYEQALTEGGLEPREVVIAYSRIGTVKAALRDKAGALSDFRVASAIDPEFELPADSGPIAKKLYEQARQEAAAQGEALSLEVNAPERIEKQTAFAVDTVIPEGFAVLVAEVVVTVEDPVTKKKWRRRKPSEAKLSFKFPERVAIEGARLKVKASAVDGQNNAWVVAETEVTVAGTRETFSMESDPIDPFEPEAPPEEDEKKKKKKFLKGPIPWIIAGGVVLAGGLTAIIATRKSKEVEVGSPTWQ